MMQEVVAHKKKQQSSTSKLVWISLILFIACLNVAYFFGHDKFGFPSTYVGTVFYFSSLIFALFFAYFYVANITKNFILLCFAIPLLSISIFVAATLLTALLYTYIIP